MNDGSVFPGGSGGGSHLTDERWLSFELRMRRRRLGRCLLRADLAIDDGRLDDARAALDDAREVDPLAREIDELEVRLTRIHPHFESEPAEINPVVTALVTLPPSGSWRFEVPQRRGLPWRVLLASAAVLACGLAASYAARSRGPAPAAPVQVSSAGIPQVPPRPEGISGGPNADHTSAKSRLLVLRETLSVLEATPRVVEDPLQMPPALGPPIADAAIDDTAVVRALNRSEPPLVPPVVEPRRDAIADATVPAVSMPPSSMVPDAVRTEARLEAPTPPAAVPAPAPAGTREPAVPAQTELSMVRAVLQKYESAYSSLDAAAASDIWPGVDRGALSRAFDGLARQQVSLGSCDVAVKGSAATVTCSGSATWQPKIGGRIRTEPRQWSFDLRKMNGGWRIERALAK